MQGKEPLFMARYLESVLEKDARCGGHSQDVQFSRSISPEMGSGKMEKNCRRNMMSPHPFV